MIRSHIVLVSYTPELSSACQVSDYSALAQYPIGDDPIWIRQARASLVAVRARCRRRPCLRAPQGTKSQRLLFNRGRVAGKPAGLSVSGARDGREKRVSPSTKNVASRSKQNAHLSPFPRNFHPSSPDFTPDRQALVVGLSPTQPKYFILLTRRCDVKRQSGFSKLSFRRDGRDPSFLCAKLMSLASLPIAGPLHRLL